MATAGQVSVTTETAIYSTSEYLGATEFVIRVVSGNALIRIPGLHADGEFYPMPADSEQVFRIYPAGIKTVYAKGSGGAAVLNYAIVSIG